MLAVQATPQKAQEIVKKPILAITYAIFIIWWVISSFVHSDNNESSKLIIYFKYILNSLLILCIFFSYKWCILLSVDYGITIFGFFSCWFNLLWKTDFTFTCSSS